MRPSELHRHFRELPLASLAALAGDTAAVILAPHQDDESLGCGGLIAAACQAGMPPLVVFITDGAASHPGSRRFGPAARCAIREQEARNSAAVLGLTDDRLVFLRLPDGAAPHDGVAFDAAVLRIVQLVERESSRAIFAPWQHDPHGDHVAAYRMAKAAAGRTGARLLSYPIWGWTLSDETELPDALPNGMRLDIAGQLGVKRAAIAAHASQHGKVITDDPGGFTISAEFLALFDVPFEVFLWDAA
ncbi:MAG TPA: PIG-L deacetylase family protein [Acetobacteraceae bacterium]